MVGARAAACSLLLLSVCACGSVPVTSASPAAGQDLNVTGTVNRGIAPTCPTDEPCDPAVVAAMLVFSAPGKADVRVRVAGDGSFALHLDPGAYTISAAPPIFRGRLEPSEVRVPDQGAVQLRLRVVSSP